MATDDELIQEWTEWRKRAETLGEHCKADADFALSEGIQPEIERAQGRIYDRTSSVAPVNVTAGWYRAAGKKIIPSTFIWHVQEMIGGGAAFLLDGFSE